jgi:hypothetical protein
LLQAIVKKWWPRREEGMGIVSGSFDVDQHRLREIAAAAFQYAHREAAFTRSEGEPQRRGDGNGALAGTPPEHAPRAAFACGDREPAQHAVVVRAEPRECGAALRRAQRLLVGPQLIGGTSALDDEQPPEIEPCARQRRRVRDMRWRDPDDVVALRLQPRERGQHETDLADALALEDDLGQGGLRPTAAGQHRVERGKARWQRGGLGRAVATAPDRGVRQYGGEGRIHQDGGKGARVIYLPTG